MEILCALNSRFWFLDRNTSGVSMNSLELAIALYLASCCGTMWVFHVNVRKRGVAENCEPARGCILGHNYIVAAATHRLFRFEVIMYWRGQCSPVNNVLGDNIHR